MLIFDGADELDVVGPYGVLATGAALGAPLRVTLVTAEPRDEVVTDHGIVLRPHGVLDEDVDLLVVPGGGWNDRRERGARAEAERGVLPRAIAARHAAGATVASVCTGAMLVAAAGLVAGRPAATHHGATAELAAAGARVVPERVVDDGDLVSCGGVTAGLDLALWLLEREFGAELAARVAADIEHERRGGVARGGAAPPA